VWVIVKGPQGCTNPALSRTYLLSALTECHTVLLKASKLLKTDNSDSKSERKSDPDDSFSKLFPSPPPVVSTDIKLVNKAKRKTLYLLAFANEFMDNSGLNACTDVFVFGT